MQLSIINRSLKLLTIAAIKIDYTKKFACQQNTYKIDRQKHCKQKGLFVYNHRLRHRFTVKIRW